MITLFCCPKPFRGHINVIQRNAIHSWALLRPKPEIILFGNEEGTAEVAEEFNLRRITEVERNDFGTPLVNSIFNTAESASSNDVLCYINSDIILLSDFTKAIQSAVLLKSNFLLIGQRWNLDITEPIDFSTNWENVIKDFIRERGKLHFPNGVDYFVFRKGAFGNIKAFALGRTIWDNWLVSKARLQKVPVIDLTNMVTVIHQNHDYSHSAGGRMGVIKGDEARKNVALAQGFIFAFTTWDADYKLTPDGIIRKSFIHRFYGDLVNLSQRYPSIKPTVRIVKLAREGFRVVWYGFRKVSFVGRRI